ncbi:MAG: putative glycosyltransferase, exosortase G system-associated [Alistipes sp.]|nr:putative glycosyltransferase, exosortase G system-associated [Alistipes sp.]
MKAWMINSEILFWVAWVILPLIIEIIPAVVNFFLLVLKYFRKKKLVVPALFPEITIIIPVYNSSATLYKCLESVYLSDYDNRLMTVYLVDNGSRDDSFSVFEKCQTEFSDLSMYWLVSNQGKSKALNKALFSSRGKYIINVDSDGRFEKEAIRNIVMRFENNLKTTCLTGAILTEYSEIEETEDFLLRNVRRLEYLEYCQAFLAGRNFSSDINGLYTLSGAFSAFRKSTILQTQMYNSDTICEDTHITFQIKRQKKRVELCENAIFYVSPIDDMAKLYTQRQRWQVGELEVFHMFYGNNMKFSNLFKDIDFRVILFDHTFAFPRLIWYFALIALSLTNYSLKTVLTALLLIYALYVCSTFLYFLNVCSFLKEFKEDRKYYISKALYIFVYPFYNLYTFILRFMGIINSINRQSSWKTFNFREEWEIIKDIVRKDFHIKEKEND